MRLRIAQRSSGGSLADSAAGAGRPLTHDRDSAAVTGAVRVTTGAGPGCPGRGSGPGRRTAASFEPEAAATHVQIRP